MQALVTQPGHTHTTHIEDVPAVEAREGEVLVRTLEVGVCGTDREISEGLFGLPPEDEPRLVLGHEALAVVERDGYGFTRGQLVTATVRRSCGHCIACAESRPRSASARFDMLGRSAAGSRGSSSARWSSARARSVC